MQIRCPFCKATIEQGDETAWCAKCRVEFRVAEIDEKPAVFKPTFDVTDCGEVEGWEIYTADGEFMGHVEGPLEMAIEAVRSGEAEWPVTPLAPEEDASGVLIPHPRCRRHGPMEVDTWQPDQDGSVFVLWRCKECGATVEMTVQPGSAEDD